MQARPVGSQATLAGANAATPSFVADVRGTYVASLVVGDGTLTSAPDTVTIAAKTFQTQPNFAAGDEPLSVAVADLNADTFPDLVTAHEIEGNRQDPRRSAVLVHLGNGDGTFQTTRADFAVGDRPRSVAVADLNADTFPDLVTANESSDNVSVLLGNGDGTFRTQATFTAGKSPLSVAVADLNADTVPDLVTANSGSDSVTVLLGIGDGTFQRFATFAVGDEPRSVAVADLNADTVPDLVTANRSSNNVSVLLGTGALRFQMQAAFAAGDEPVSVAIADLNADTVLDLVTANFGSDNVSVLIAR